LAYEVLWARMLSLQFGVSIFGVMLAVSAFMAGLGAGCLAGSRWITKNPLVAFAALEATVALVAFSMPVFMGIIDGLVSKVGSDIGLSAWYWVQGASAFFVLFLPAVVLGATFPTMVKTLIAYVPIGAIYGLNSLGGAMGALSPLVLLPALGWTISNYAVGMTGLIVATTAFVLSGRFKRAEFGPRDESRADTPVRAARHDYVALLAYAGIGFAAITLQIAWARLFGMVFLRTEYVLAVLLCVFLVGIALGSFFGRVFSRPYWLSIFPSLSALFAVLSLWGLPPLALWMAEASFSSLTAAVWWQAGGIALLTLPVTLVLGAWFPLVTQRMRDTNDVAGPRLYTVNSFGAALGGLAAGVVFIPELGTPATVIIAALVLLVCGSAWANRRASLLFGLIIVALAWPVKKLPEVGVLLPSTMGETRDIYKFEDMVSITHVVEDPQGQRVLLGDLNRMEASSDPTAVVSQKNQARLPLLLHHQPQSILFLGLGTGISAAGSLPYPKLDRSVVELSAGAIAAAEDYFGLVNEQVMERMKVTRDDARRFLRRTPDRYDVIVGDLFHPDLVGRSALLSRQQFQRAKGRLNERGVFVQWLALNQFDLGALQVVLRTFKSVFPDAVMFLDGFKLAMVGSPDGNAFAISALANMGRLEWGVIEQVTGAEGMGTWMGR
jgi:spermidine synthase